MQYKDKILKQRFNWIPNQKIGNPTVAWIRLLYKSSYTQGQDLFFRIN